MAGGVGAAAAQSSTPMSTQAAEEANKLSDQTNAGQIWTNAIKNKGDVESRGELDRQTKSMKMATDMANKIAEVNENAIKFRA
jgi:hypothetical protein